MVFLLRSTVLRPYQGLANCHLLQGDLEAADDWLNVVCFFY